MISFKRILLILLFCFKNLSFFGNYLNELRLYLLQLDETNDNKLIKYLIMGTIATNKKKLTFYYHPESSIGKQAYVFALASNKKNLAINISKTKITGTQWLEISENLNIILSKLVNQEHPEFTKNYDSGLSLDKNNWIKVLQNHPETLRCPILVDGKNYHLIETPYKVINLFENVETVEGSRI